MAWRRPGDKLLSEPMMVRLPMHTCVTRPQWVNRVSVTIVHLWDTWTLSALNGSEHLDTFSSKFLTILLYQLCRPCLSNRGNTSYLFLNISMVGSSHPVNSSSLDKMALISHMMFWKAFSWMKILEFRWKFHWSLFLWVQLTISEHWFR